MPFFEVPNMGLQDTDANARKRSFVEMYDDDVVLGDGVDFVSCEKQKPAMDGCGSPQNNRKMLRPRSIRYPTTSPLPRSTGLTVSITDMDTTPKRVRIASPASSPLSSPGSMIEGDWSTNSPSPNPTPTDASPSRRNTSSSTLARSSPKKQSSTAPDASKAISDGKSTSSQPAKRRRLTASEKQAQEEEKEKKRLEREQKKKESEEKKAKAEAEKEQKKKEAAEKKAKIEAEKQARAQEKEAKRQQKEDEERKIQEQKDKKERSQMKLNSFFIKPPASTPKKTQPIPGDDDKSSTPAKDDQGAAESQSPLKTKKQDASETTPYYNKLFKPFFVKKDVRLASSPFAADEETKDAKSRMLDEYISGQRGALETKKFDPVDMLELREKPKPRGRIHEPVGTTVKWFQCELERAVKKGDLQKQEALQKRVKQKLGRVPVKVICFQQDVRPPYRGTVTVKQHEVGTHGMRKLARNPTAPVIKSLLYGYDSEAEWQDDEGEDLDLDDDEDDDLEDDDDVANLIDDTEAVDLTRFASGLEPSSSGLCWEDAQGANHCASAPTGSFAMEFIVGGKPCTTRQYRRRGTNNTYKDRLQRNLGIDPFSTEYWAPEKKPKQNNNNPTSSSATNKQQQLESGPTAAAGDGADAKSKGKNGAGNGGGLPAGLSSEDLERIKKEIKKNFETTPRISKLGMIEYLKSSALDGVKINGKDISRGDVKLVLDVVAARRKMKGGEVSWSLKPGHELGAYTA